MTKTKYFECYDWTFKSYIKPVGQGWECGVYFGGKPVFVGNFIHKTEATRWYNLMNRQMTTFFKKYSYTTMPPKAWYGKFFANHMYTVYYKYLDKLFTKYNRTYNTAFNSNVKYFNKYKKTHYTYTRAA